MKIMKKLFLHLIHFFTAAALDFYKLYFVSLFKEVYPQKMVMERNKLKAPVPAFAERE